MSSSFSAHLMMVRNNLIYSLQPIAQGNTASRPTAFFKVKIKKLLILLSLLVYKYALRESKVLS